ncbi:hypothetical protein [Bradyrhizobium elkanii]|uniref:hypothetical protein n=1 Tax=Bradyrhizobium elkanii TaxID=29448 RepID=UPI003D19BA2E
MIAKMPTAEATKIESTAFSRKVRRSVFGIGLHGWEQLMLLSLGVTGLIAFAVAFTTASVVILTRHETAEAKRELEEYKLTVEAKVADATARGIEAGKSAGAALVRAADLEKQAEQLRKDTAEANARAAQASLQVEYLKKLRGPRSVPYNALNALRSMPSRTAQIWYAKDSDDAEDLAANIAGALQHAGWKAGFREIETAESAGGEPTGVTVLDNQFPGTSNPTAVLVEILTTVLGECSSNIGRDLPEDTVRIIVGPKP